MSYVRVKKIITLGALIFCLSVVSTSLSRSTNGQDDDPLKNVVIAPTDWDSLKSIQTSSDDCGPEAKPTSCAGGLPKPKTTEEARGLIIASECYNGSNVSKVLVARKPCFPSIAKSAKASGAVDVMVVVDESGAVIWAHATKGHPLLQFAAVRAASKWRFEPVVCGDEKRSVNRMITFNFDELK